MSDSAVTKAFSRPPAGVWKGEAALGSLAYFSKIIKRPSDAVDPQTRIDDFRQQIIRANNGNGLPIFDSTLPYSPDNIAARYKVIASTGDDFVQARLGNDGNGGTSSGYQAIIFYDTVNRTYVLSSSGVTGTVEFTRAASEVATYGYFYSWAKDLRA